jgi:predicted nucleic acid-binding protein
VTCAVVRTTDDLATAVDTNVFISLLSGDEEEAAVAQVALERVSARGKLAVPLPVYAELVAGGRGPEEVERFLGDKGIDIVSGTSRNIWRDAGVRYGRYARDRRQQKEASGPRRILADFVIGAHALHLSRTLLTSDSGIFTTYFSELEILTPEGLAR